MKHLVLFLTLFFSFFAFPQSEIPDKPDTARLVNDLASILSNEQETFLEKKLLDNFVQTSTQISLVTVKSIYNYEVNDYASRLAEKWGIGSAKYDNGILVLLKPKTKEEKGQVYIATGYGLEGAVPDIIANRIADNIMIPHFKQGRIFEGINAGIDALILATKGEYDEKQYVENKKNSNSILIIFLFIIILFIIFILRRKKYLTLSSSGKSTTSLADILSSSRKYHSGSFKGFTTGTGSFKGTSFGSYGGFGGGSFGGGGAGGSW